MPFEDVQALGREIVEREPGRFETEGRLGAARPGIAMLCYTSGTTGLPKGVMLSHGNIPGAIRSTTTSTPPRHRQPRQLPAPGLDRRADPGLAAHVYAGVIINFPKNGDRAAEHPRDRPGHALLQTPAWDSAGRHGAGAHERCHLAQPPYRRFLPIGYRMADARFSGSAAGPGVRAAYAVGDRLVFAPARPTRPVAHTRCPHRRVVAQPRRPCASSMPWVSI